MIATLLLLCRYDCVPSGQINGNDDDDDDTAQRRERRVPATVRGRRTGGDMAQAARPRLLVVVGRTGENASRRRPICF